VAPPPLRQSAAAAVCLGGRAMPHSNNASVTWSARASRPPQVRLCVACGQMAGGGRPRQPPRWPPHRLASTAPTGGARPALRAVGRSARDGREGPSAGGPAPRRSS